MVIKHLFKRTIKRNGKKVTAWYFWYYDENGRRVRRTCGKKRIPCTTKREALMFLASFDDSELGVGGNNRTTIREMVSGLFDKGSPYLKRRESRGYTISESTRRQREKELGLFLEKFGDRKPESVRARELDDWALSFGFSNSWRNHLLTVVKDAFREMQALGAVRSVPAVERFKQGAVCSKGVLSRAELSLLFPSDHCELMRIWSAEVGDRPYHAYTAACACFCMVSTGMRSGECRALMSSQIIDRSALFLNASMDAEGRRVCGLKKRSAEDPRWRVAVLPDRAAVMLDMLWEMREAEGIESEYVFERNGKPLDRGYLCDRLRYALARIGIDARGRNITTHSLRFTYNTLMRREISEEDLRLLMGHKNERMTDYYDKSGPLDNLPMLMRDKSAINSVFG